MALTYADIIQVGKVSAYLAQLDVLNSALYGRKLDPRLPLMLQIETDAIEWRYELDPTDVSLIHTTNYLYELCGAYAITALSVIAGGGGSTVTPVAPNGYIYNSLEFVVTATNTGSGAPVDNTTVWTNPIFINGQQLSFIIVDGVPEIINNGFTFNSSTGTITRTNPFFAGSTVVVPFLRKL